MPLNQIESEIEDRDNGFNADKYRPKKRKWKSKVRNYKGNERMKHGKIKMKRPANILSWESPN